MQSGILDQRCPDDDFLYERYVGEVARTRLSLASVRWVRAGRVFSNLPEREFMVRLPSAAGALCFPADKLARCGLTEFPILRQTS